MLGGRSGLLCRSLQKGEIVISVGCWKNTGDNVCAELSMQCSLHAVYESERISTKARGRMERKGLLESETLVFKSRGCHLLTK